MEWQGKIEDIPMAAKIGHTLGILLPIIGNLTQQAAYIVDLYLDPKHAKA